MQRKMIQFLFKFGFFARCGIQEKMTMMSDFAWDFVMDVFVKFTQ